MTENDWESGTLQNDWRNDWDPGFLHCIANAPRTRAAFDMRFFSCPARARGAGHEIISEVRSLFMRGAFDRQQSIHRLLTGGGSMKIDPFSLIWTQCRTVGTRTFDCTIHSLNTG